MQANTNSKIIRTKGFKNPNRIALLLLLVYTISTPLIAGANKEYEDHYNYERGKRLFHGLARPMGGSGDPINCASCHNTYSIDTLNWNPSAVDIALSTANADSMQFANYLLSPISKKLNEAHANFELTPDEIQLIRKYLRKIENAGFEKEKPKPLKLIVFIGMFLVFGWAVSDLIVIKKVDKKYIHAIVLLITSIYMAKVLVEESILLGRSQDYQPLQPIKFSHVIHAQENQIDCQYCHHTAEHSKSANIPSANLCLNCHTLIREGTHSGRFEINKIHAAIDSSKPIEWIRIHRLPDFVYFNHAQHVNAGKLDCRECHGAVEDMHVVKQENDLSMGWCLDCHRSRAVNFIENDYYGMTFEDFHNKIKDGSMDSVTVAQIGGEDCMKCHY